MKELSSNKSLKAAHIRSQDSFSLGMLRILCPALRCPLALRYALEEIVEKIEIKASVTKRVLATLGLALPFSIAYAAFIGVSNFYAAIAFILFLTFLVVLIWRGPKIIITLSNSGITDHRTSFGEIPWDDVEHISIRNSTGQLVISIGEFKWERLLESLPRWKAFVYELNLPGDIIFIGKGNTDMNLEKLFEVVTNYADRAKGSHAK